MSERSADWALFLDVDATLARAAREQVLVQRLKALLAQLYVQLDGAVALLSALALEDLDSAFAPFKFPAAAIHGNVLREPNGCVKLPAMQTEILATVKPRLQSFVARNRAVRLDDRFYSLAIDFAENLPCEALVRGEMQAAWRALPRGFTLITTQTAVEICPIDGSKQMAVATLMRSSPFVRRRAVIIGDNVTDESSFAYVNQTGGLSIGVGRPRDSVAGVRLDNLTEALAWLESHTALVPGEPAPLPLREADCT